MASPSPCPSALPARSSSRPFDGRHLSDQLVFGLALALVLAIVLPLAFALRIESADVHGHGSLAKSLSRDEHPPRVPAGSSKGVRRATQGRSSRHRP